MTNSLLGRGDLIEAVRVLLTRPVRDGRPYNTFQPVLVVEGARGAGRTALMKHLVRRLDSIPYAYLNLGGPGTLELPQILSAIAFQLGQGNGRPGPMAFPRLTIGVIACGADIGGLSEVEAGRRLAAALREHRGTNGSSNVLRQSAGEFGRGLHPPGHRADTRTTLSVLTQRRGLGRYTDWYAQGQPGPASGIGRLIELARWSANPALGDHRHRVGRALWRALLADLTESFRTARRADELTMNCLLMIDDVDGSPGQATVSSLVQVRRERESTRGDHGDPLTVVVSSRGRFLKDEAPPPTAVTALSTWHADQSVVWLRATLRDLSPEEVAEMVSTVLPRETDGGRVARTVYRLTHGHPMTTSVLLRSIQRDRGLDLDLPSVNGDGAGHRSVADDVVAQQLGDLPDEVLEDLITLSAARNITGATRLAAMSEMLPAGDLLDRDSAPESLWSVDPLDWPHAVRYLLLRRLDARPEADTPWTKQIIPGRRYPSWTQTFEWLRDDCRQINDDDSALYYALAAGRFADVVKTLVDGLSYLPGEEWLDLLHATTSAPRRHRGPGQPAPVAQVQEILPRLAENDELIRAMAQGHRSVTLVADLVARLWVIADPLSGEPLGPLHWHLAGSYQELRGYLPHVPEHLSDLHDQHQRLRLAGR